MHHSLTQLIADMRQAAICFYNPGNGKIEDLHPQWAGDPESFENITGEKWDETFTCKSRARVVSFEPPDSSASFSIMEDFASFVAEVELQETLLDALFGKKPFRNFKHVIESSPPRQR
jgi:hypothetical protein